MSKTSQCATIDCPECGVPFQMPSSLDTQRRRDHKPFWCPNGHRLIYRHFGFQQAINPFFVKMLEGAA